MPVRSGARPMPGTRPGTAAGRSEGRRTPVTKAARQAMIRTLLEGGQIRSQSDFVRRLAEAGVPVTQATLSRDLDEIGATKVRGRYAVASAGNAGGEAQVARLGRLVGELLVTAEGSGQFTVIRTPPGGANLLASALDRAALPEVMGTVAGDDTVLIICRSGDAGPRLARRMLNLAESRTPGTPPPITPERLTPTPSEETL